MHGDLLFCIYEIVNIFIIIHNFVSLCICILSKCYTYSKDENICVGIDCASIICHEFI